MVFWYGGWNWDVSMGWGAMRISHRTSDLSTHLPHFVREQNPDQGIGGGRRGEEKRASHLVCIYIYICTTALSPPSYFPLGPAGGKGVRPSAGEEEEGPSDLVCEVVGGPQDQIGVVERGMEGRVREAQKVCPGRRERREVGRVKAGAEDDAASHPGRLIQQDLLRPPSLPGLVGPGKAPFQPMTGLGHLSSEHHHLLPCRLQVVGCPEAGFPTGHRPPLAELLRGGAARRGLGLRPTTLLRRENASPGLDHGGHVPKTRAVFSSPPGRQLYPHYHRS